MTTTQAVKVLKKFLPQLLIIELEIVLGSPRSITICCTVERIIKEFNSTQEIEDAVEQALQVILKRHFA